MNNIFKLFELSTGSFNGLETAFGDTLKYTSVKKDGFYVEDKTTLTLRDRNEKAVS